MSKNRLQFKLKYVDNKTKRKIRQWLREFKYHKSCIFCGEDHPATLQFHHRNPRNGNEGATINNLIRSGASLKRVQEEIDRCDIVCANCHTKLHWKD